MTPLPEKVIHCYDATASPYADQFYHELSKKHFDRIILRAFAAANKNQGLVADFGCGPGQASRFLKDQGVDHLLGVDISPGMVEMALKLNPDIDFAIGNMLGLEYPDHHFAAAIAFYAIVHFDEQQLRTAFREIYRVLEAGGEFLFSYHIGTEIRHFDQFLEKPVDIDFYFFETEKVLAFLQETGFKVIDVLERHPYPDVEYPSRRAYVWVAKHILVD